MTHSVTVIIPVYNNNEGVTKCINSIIRGSVLPDEIIVVDDGSRFPPRYEHPLVRVYSTKNGGPASARNIGASIAKSNYIFFTDSDCWLEVDAIKNIKIAIQNGCKGIAGPYGLTKNNKIVAKYCDVDLFARYKNIIGGSVYVHGTYNLTVSRADFLSINGFDINFPRPSGEDFDLVLRISDKFGPLKFVNKVVVYTDHETKIKSYLKKQIYRGYDRIYYYIKNKNRLNYPDYYTVKSDYLDLLIFPALICGVLISPFIFLYLIFNFLIFYFYKIKGFKGYKINTIDLIELYILNSLRFSAVFIGLVRGLVARIFK